MTTLQVDTKTTGSRGNSIGVKSFGSNSSKETVKIAQFLKNLPKILHRPLEIATTIIWYSRFSFPWYDNIAVIIIAVIKFYDLNIKMQRELISNDIKRDI